MYLNVCLQDQSDQKHCLPLLQTSYLVCVIHLHSLVLHDAFLELKQSISILVLEFKHSFQNEEMSPGQ